MNLSPRNLASSSPEQIIRSAVGLENISQSASEEPRRARGKAGRLPWRGVAPRERNGKSHRATGLLCASTPAKPRQRTHACDGDGADRGGLENWVEAARAMADYGRLACELRRLAAREEESIRNAREQFACLRGGPERQCAELARALEKFARAHKREFRSAPGTTGRACRANGVSMGFRLTPPAVRVRDEGAALEWLTKAGLERFVRTSREPDREALRSALANGDLNLAERLAAHGITLDQHDKFFIEIRED